MITPSNAEVWALAVLGSPAPFQPSLIRCLPLGATDISSPTNSNDPLKERKNSMKTSIEIEVRNYREQEIEYRDKQGEIAKFTKKTITGLDSDGQIVVASLGRNCKLPPLSTGDVVCLSWARAEQKDGLWMLSGCLAEDNGGAPF